MKISRPKFFKLKLFWKILIWFWLATSLIIVVNLYIVKLNSEQTHFRPLPPHAKKELFQIKKRALKYLANSNINGRVNFKRIGDIFILGPNDQDYFNQPIPEPLADLHQRVKRNDRPMSVFFKRKVFLGGIKIQIKNEEYRVYIRRLDSPLSRHFIGGFFREMTKSLLFSIFIVSFPVSFLLSWLITTPIKKLRQATQEMQVNLKNKNSFSKLKKRSDEFGDLANDFDILAEYLEKTLNSQKHLISDMSHELRSPLSRLKVATGLIEQKYRGEFADAEVNEFLQRIKQESNRMNEMLDNLLSISKLENQEVAPKLESLDLSAIFKMAIEDGRFEAENINIEIDESLPGLCHFYGNQESLSSGIENILRNAIKYTGKNGKISCVLKQQENAILLSVSDTGPGVSPEHLTKLFDPFYRPEFARSRGTGGVGLGLAIAKRAFALNNGEIFAENINPHGLKISVIFKTD